MVYMQNGMTYKTRITSLLIIKSYQKHLILWFLVFAIMRIFNVNLESVAQILSLVLKWQFNHK